MAKPVWMPQAVAVITKGITGFAETVLDFCNAGICFYRSKAFFKSSQSLMKFFITGSGIILFLVGGQFFVLGHRCVFRSYFVKSEGVGVGVSLAVMSSESQCVFRGTVREEKVAVRSLDRSET